MALADEDGSLTFSELDERVNRLINALRGAGLTEGDTIAIVSGNRNEWFELALACANTGITHVPVNWHLVADRGATSDAPARFKSFEAFVEAGEPAEPENQSFGGPMFYTSGTTGNPKGVRSSLSAMEPGTTPEVWHLIGAGFSQLLEVPGVTALCGPVYHSAQWAFSFLPMMAGSATVM